MTKNWGGIRRIRLGKFGITQVAMSAMATAGVISIASAAQQPPTPLASQDGAKAYAEHCAACHGPDLGGAVGPSIGPALSGNAFVAKWKSAPAGAFLDYVEKAMPLNQPGGLDPATYLATSNYIRAKNGLPPEPAPAAGKTAAAATMEQQPGMAAFGPDLHNQDAPYRAAMQQRAALGERLTPVTDAILANPPEQDWLAWRRTPSTLGFSPMRQINRGNVSQLGLAWSLALGSGTNAIAPLVHDGVMFINSNGTVQALDARNGDPIWEYARPATTTRVPSNQTRGMALYGSNLYVPTIDGHMLALDARTGKLVWDHEITKPADDLELTAAPLVAHGKIIQGVSGCQGAGYPGGCFIVALDAKSGDELWRFHTIARPGQPGGDSWNGSALKDRFGGSVWVTGSYDPELNLVYFGTGQTYIVSTLLKSAKLAAGQSRDALFTDSTLALNPDTGKLAWYYQHAPGDVWDLDWAFEQSVVTLPTPTGPRKAIVTSGKTAIIDAVDAKTGEYLWSYDMSLQNLVTAIDSRTGRKTYDSALIPEVGKSKLVCPSTIGARNWNATAYDPSLGLMYLPLVQNCMGIGLAAGSTSTYHTFGEFVQERRDAPGGDGTFGRIAALDLKTRKLVWTNHYRAPQSSAILATGSGLLFEGGRDRWFRALDGTTGKSLWQTRLDNTPNAFPITYMVDGRQYVAIVAGGGTPVDLFLSTYTPEFRSSIGGKTLMVFALPKPPGQP